jgi:hypothetical protein
MQNLMLRPDIILAMQRVSLKQYDDKFSGIDSQGVRQRMAQDTQVFGYIHDHHMHAKIQHTLLKLNEDAHTY